MSFTEHPAGAADFSLRRVTVPAGLYLAAHFLAYVAPARLWGVDGLTYLPFWFAPLFALAILIILVPALRDPVAVAVDHARRVFAGDRIPLFRRLVLASVLFIVLSSVFASAVPLLGDGQLHIRALGDQHWESNPQTDHSPLVFWVMHHVFLWIAETRSAAACYAGFSQAAGVAFLLLSVAGSRVFSTDRNSGHVVLLLLITQGYVQHFFGYVENYAILFPMLLAFLVLCQRCMVGRTPVWIPGVVLGVTVSLHLITLAAAPALAWATLRRTGRVTISVVSLAVVPATACIVLVLIGLPYDAFLHLEPGHHTLQLLGEADHYRPYALISWSHAMELWNQYALVAPAALICLGLARRFQWRDPTDTMLFLAAAPLVAFTVLFNPEIGAFRNWDVFALPALPLTLLAGRWLGRAYAGVETSRIAVSVVVIASLVHTASWVGLNANADAAAARFDHNVQEGANSDHARSHGAGSLADYHREEGRLDESLAAFRAASRYGPYNSRYYVAQAYILNLMGRKGDAERVLEEALDLDPDRPDVLVNLSKLSLERGQTGEAKRLLLRALKADPSNAGTIHGLGMVAYRTGDLTVARDLFRQASEMNSRNVNYAVDLGMGLQSLGDLGQAEVLFREVIEREPGMIRARMNLGMVYYERQDYAAAAAAYRSVLNRDATQLSAHLNLGLTLIELGDPESARKYLERALELNPEDEEADQIRITISELK